MPRLFALDHNFPDPIVTALQPYQTHAELVRIDAIDARMAELDDWQIFLALRNHPRPWDGLITTDSSMLMQGKELVTLAHARLTLVVAIDAGNNPVKAAGLLFAHLENICTRTKPNVAQVWKLQARATSHTDVGDLVRAVAKKRHRQTGDLWHEHRLTPAQLAVNPLSSPPA